MTTEIATRPEAPEGELTIAQIVGQVAKIQECMNLVFKKDEHYGVIPGTGTADKPGKPTLLKPGAEKLCLLFRLDPEYEVMQSVEEPTRISYMIRCVLHHIPTGRRIASGLGSCNSREEKYMRPAPRKCPNCGKEAIIKGKEEYGGGWLCFARKGGCNGKWRDGDAAIEKQDTGLKDPADLANTILKMACKRALVAAVLNGTAASDFFTQDLEDLQEKRDAIDVAIVPAQPREQYAPSAGGAAREAPKASAPNAASKAASSPASSSAESAPTATTGATTRSAVSAEPRTAAAATSAPKLPRADQVPHDGTFASPKQVALLHTLATKLEIACDGNCAIGAKKYSKKAGGLVDVTHLCKYHTGINAFRDCDGNRIKSSKALSARQISVLIDRMQAAISRRETRALEPLDIGPVNDTARISDEGVISIRDYLRSKELDEIEFCSMWGVDSVAELSDADAANALALVLAHGTPQYEAIKAQVFQQHQ